MEVLKSITLPAYINALFRNKFMGSETIALLPATGYIFGGEGRNTNASAESQQWLAWMKKELGLVELYHARNSEELAVCLYSK